ncbi:K+ transport systems, NAD-binding component [Archaeoglobus sulfaticallidus PM70-1]|uniref:K+ transport systems, NAD-binding component n=1 Tax=Archaeoglobus sulfaticallidus PM70-1 TaxID=387631 RepID=N0BP94_9EURY|nr:potassium channel protein [Archaeoglobus sulfaticallidus]AGK62175.1 K+ transport systems, NAD-binding component [Archaeoglobus sulfaticallidus PM70-1]
MRELERAIAITIILLLITIAIGTIGFTVIEGWSLFDSFYMTVITITTTGYKEVYDLSYNGRFLAIFLMFFGIGVFFYSINLIIPTIVQRRLERWRKLLEKISDHYIICGYGVMGREIAQELVKVTNKDKIVIIDENMEKVSLARENGYIAIQGDSVEEDVLERARIKHAKALIACMNDSSNAFAIMSAKEMNPNIYTMAVARTPSGVKNTKRAGADYVLSPYSDTAKKAMVILSRQSAADFLEIISKVGKRFLLEKVQLSNKNLDGKKIKDLDLRRKTGATIVAVERKGDILIPDADLSLKFGDNLYLMGSEDQLIIAGKYLSEGV